MDRVEVDGISFEASTIPSSKANILLIKGEKGFLGCGYFDIATAEILGEAVAIVTGVETYQDMLDAEVVRFSTAAGELGVEVGMTGAQALRKF
ncbi:MAG: DUF1805 domain-containing protein [Candidatus Melainabacteria bacterium]|nr:DUF1805 domain-containing protein [Candidatus Melainabacteria bacterium]